MGRSCCSILICFLWSPLASAYPTPVDVDGALHRWPLTAEKSEVHYEVIAADSTLRSYLEDLVDESAEIWSQVEGSRLKLVKASEWKSAEISIYFDPSIAGGATAAGYSIFDNVKDGVPQHCTIRIAASENMISENLSKTTLHEIGHCIGLAHSLMPQSIMSYNLDRNQFALSVDDKAALTRLYPMDVRHPALAPGCAIGHQRAQPNPLIYLAILLAPLLGNLIRFILRVVVRN